MDQDRLTDLWRIWIGRRCSVQRRECDWAVGLHGGGSFTLSAPWRVVHNGRIALADTDDGQRFGLDAPIDGEIWANRLLDGRSITSIVVDLETADLTIYFDGNVRIDVFNNSSGYEGWQAHFLTDGDSISIIAMGGGEVVLYP